MLDGMSKNHDGGKLTEEARLVIRHALESWRQSYQNTARSEHILTN